MCSCPRPPLVPYTAVISGSGGALGSATGAFCGLAVSTRRAFFFSFFFFPVVM